jgi:phytoene/squalene synthetase
LRDLKADIEDLDCRYFPEIVNTKLKEQNKKVIIDDIQNDFKEAYSDIKQLPCISKLAVLLAYYYYLILLKKIKHTPASKILETRIRISNVKKLQLLLKAMFVYKLKLV